MELSVYYICLLRKGPTWTAEVSPESETLQARHIAYTLHLREIGATVASGPVSDKSDIRGFSIFGTATLAEAEALANGDPAVQAGRFIVELHRWSAPIGALPAPNVAPQAW